MKNSADADQTEGGAGPDLLLDTPSFALVITPSQLADSAAQTLNGTSQGVAVGSTISIYDGAMLLGTATAGAGGAWTFPAFLSGSSPQALSAKATGDDDETLTSNTVYLATSGGETINFPDASNDAASLYGTAGDWDMVNGSGGFIYLSAAQASVVGGDDTISLTGASRDSLSLFNTSGQGDAVTGNDDVIALTDAQASVSGGYNTVYFEGGSDSVSLSATDGHWDWVYGDDGAITLTSAEASVIGIDDTISLTGASGDALSLFNAINPQNPNAPSDSVTGDDAAIVLTDSRASITGGYNKIYLQQADDWANVYATNGDWDVVYGDDNYDSVTLNSAQASVVGNVQVNLLGASRDYLSLYDTTLPVPEYVNAINAQNGYTGSETITLNDANAIVSGANNTIYLQGASGNVLTVQATGARGDWVYGDDGVVNVLSASVSVFGDDDTFNFGDDQYNFGFFSDTVSLNSGGHDLLVFGPGLGGTRGDIIVGFTLSDVIQFSSSDVSNWTALSGHISQSDDDTNISLGGNSVTLVGVSSSTLTSAQFSFV